MYIPENIHKDEYDKERVKKAIIQIGMENSLASKYTSFVGVDRNSGERFETKSMKLRNVKNQVPSGYGGNKGLRVQHSDRGNWLGDSFVTSKQHKMPWNKSL